MEIMKSQQNLFLCSYGHLTVALTHTTLNLSFKKFAKFYFGLYNGAKPGNLCDEKKVWCCSQCRYKIVQNHKL